MYKYIKQSPSANGGGSRHPFLKLLFAACIIAFAASILAVSCSKTAGGGNNNNNSGNNDGSGNNGDGNGGCTGICPTGTLTVTTTGNTWGRVSGNTVIVNAAGPAGTLQPLSDADDNDRGYLDADVATINFRVFDINYPSATTALIFVNRTHVSKDTITLPATVPSAATGCSGSESGDEALAIAAGGGVCRQYVVGGSVMNFYNYLGTVFNNTDTATRARGLMTCTTALNSNPAITDTTVFNRINRAPCLIAMVNNGLGNTVVIDDAWATDTRSTTEVELHAIGIDVSGKTISQFSDAPGYNLTEFIKAHDNAAFKRLLQNNPWGELKFKVKIVTAANF